MNEQEWIVSTDPKAMLAEIKAKASDRKLRLFACACCRQQAWDLLTDDLLCPTCKGPGGKDAYELTCPTCSGTGRINRSRRAVEVAERYADGRATAEELQRAYNLAPPGSTQWGLVRELCGQRVPSFARYEQQIFALLPDRQDGGDGRYVHQLQSAEQTCLLRDIFGNPWKPVQRATFWAENDTVQSLASSAYDFRDWSLLPIIADKLEDIGCCEWEFLGHLRGKQLTHCRGCWAIDLLLGKS